MLLWLVLKFIEDPTRFLNVGVIGFTNGAVYGLVALGYTLVYGILQLINFAHGDVFALSGLVASTIIVSVLGLDAGANVAWIIGGLLITLAITAPTFAVFNAGIERVAYKPLRSAPRLAPLITAVGVSFVIQNLSLALYGVDFESVPNFIPRTDAISIGDVTIQWNKIAVIAIVAPVLMVLTWFVRSTKQGKAMRAVAQDTEASAMMGIDVNRTISVTFFIAGVARRCRRARLPPPVQHALRHRVRARSDRVHCGGARRDRQPHRRGRRRDGDRPRPGVQRGPRRHARAATGRARWCSASSSPFSSSGPRASSARGHPRVPDVGAPQSGLVDRFKAERTWWLAVGLLVFGLIYPLIVGSLKTLPLIGDFLPRTDSMVVMIAFTMMALGLNIVVGYAGLLDLGYVAFYAAGAYVAGWLASQQFEQVTFHFHPRRLQDRRRQTRCRSRGSTSRCGSSSSSPGCSPSSSAS